jgi:hypothetical protein
MARPRGDSVSQHEVVIGTGKTQLIDPSGPLIDAIVYNSVAKATCGHLFCASIRSKIMETTIQVAIPMDKIAEFCRRWRIVEFALFGSVLGERFREDKVALYESPNYLRRRDILGSARVIYEK